MHLSPSHDFLMICHEHDCFVGFLIISWIQSRVGGGGRAQIKKMSDDAKRTRVNMALVVIGFIVMIISMFSCVIDINCLTWLR